MGLTDGKPILSQCLMERNNDKIPCRQASQITKINVHVLKDDLKEKHDHHRKENLISESEI